MVPVVTFPEQFKACRAPAKVEPFDDGHHHHLMCTRCSDIVELDECFSEDLQQKIAAASGYAKVTHRLEFFGVCPRCQ